MEKIITAKGIVKKFDKNEANVLNGVDVDISGSEFVALMGPSGSGKSTLLFALSGMDDITEGSVKFDGVELSSLGENELADIRRTRMGFVFQQPTMLKNLNLLDNIILPAMPGKKQKAREVTAKAKALMNKTGIGGLEQRDTTEVSGGQLQRAGICRALINSPRILFADEPTGALNSKSADEIMALLTAINREGTAILLVTHDAKVAARADRILFTKDGSITHEMRFEENRGNGMRSEKYHRQEMEARVDKVVRQMTAIGI